MDRVGLAGGGRRRKWGLAVLAGAMFALPAAAEATEAAVTPVECPRELRSLDARCGTLDVALDHTGRVPGTQRLALAVVPARGTRVGTLAFVPGGPGQAALPLAPVLTGVLREAAPGHDLLFVDPRGTGGSDPVDCPANTPTSLRRVAACGERLGARRATLTTYEQVSDLEDVRAQLGIPQLTLLGVSYGTKVAAQYLRRFPDRTARAILDSPTPPEALDTLSVLRAFALPRVLREVCHPPGCEAFLGKDPVAAVGELVERLGEGGLRARVVDQRGRRSTVRVTLPLLATLVAVSDIDPFLRVELPRAVGAALRGDGAYLARLVAGLASLEGDEALAANTGRFLATACVEGRFPWSPESAPASREPLLAAYLEANAAAYAPFPAELLFAQVGLPCIAWPSTPAPVWIPRAAPPVPTLIVAGRDDLRTPVEDARRSAGDYPSVRLLNVPDVGHSVLGSDVSRCAVSRVRAFVRGEEVRNCERGPRPLLDVAAPVPASLAALPVTRPLRGEAGRTLTAAIATVQDAGRQALATALSGAQRAGGLRGGRLRASRRGIDLVDYEVVRGVRVSGRLADRGGRLEVTGAYAEGALTLRGTRLRGTLGGQRVSVRVPR